jgi:hypothetical protein
MLLAMIMIGVQVVDARNLMDNFPLPPSEVHSLTFTTYCKTQCIGTYQAVNQGVQHKTVEYTSSVGSMGEVREALRMVIIDIHGQVIMDRTKVFTPEQKMWFDGLSRNLTVGSVVPGSDKLLDNACGIFFPIRFLIQRKDGRPVDVEGYIPPLSKWTSRDWIQSKAKALAEPFTPAENGESRWKFIVERSTRPGHKNSYYLVQFNPKIGQAVVWEYYENGKLKEDWQAIHWQEVDGIRVLQSAYMTHYVDGAPFSHSQIEVYGVRMNFEPDMSVFEFDPAVAESIYDRDTKTLVKVPK